MHLKFPLRKKLCENLNDSFFKLINHKFQKERVTNFSSLVGSV